MRISAPHCGKLALALLLLATTACEKRRSEAADQGQKTLVRLSDDEVKSLDPQKISDLTSLRIASDQFEGLTRYKGDGTVEPGLAKSWSHDKTGLRWRFVLKREMFFSDGRPIDSGTFAAGIQRLLDPKTGSPNAALFGDVKAISPDGPHALEITLTHPFPALPELLAHPAAAALPMHRIALAGDGWTSDRPLVTSGAYRLSEWKLHDRIILVRNPRWHDLPARIARVEWRAGGDAQTAFRQFRAGQIDLVSNFPSERKSWLDRYHPGTAQVSPYRGSFYFVFNTRRAPFDDARVRRALSLAAERRLIADRLLGIGNPPAWGVVPPGILAGQGDFRPAWADWPRAARVALARRLLAEAGYNDTRPLRFEIRFNSDVDYRRIALALLDNWRDLPVKPSLLNTEATLHFASLRRGDFDLARSGWIGDLSAPENFLAIYQSNAGSINYSGYRNPVFDSLYNAALDTAEPGLRAARMRAAEAQLMEDAPVLPVYYYVTKNLVGNRVTGWKNNIANVHPSHSLDLKDSTSP